MQMQCDKGAPCAAHFRYHGCLLHHRFAMPKLIAVTIRYRSTGWHVETK